MQALSSKNPLNQSHTQPLNSEPRTDPVRLQPRRIGSLLAAYKQAMAELDARPARYTPYLQITSRGRAALLHSVIDSQDAAERIARQNRENAEKAAADLLRTQQKHPLYNTHHRPELIAWWSKHGHAPHTPHRALDGFTAYIMRNATAGEEEIKEIAERLERVSTITLQERLGHYADGYLDPNKPTERTAKNLRRTLRSAIRQFNEQAAHILRLVTNKRQKYVSDQTRTARRHQLAAQERWLSNTYIVDKSTENQGERIPLSDCIRTAEHRFAELYTLVRGQEKYFTNAGYIPVFITLTAPAEYHPAPANGTTKWDGSSVRDSHDWFTQGWQLVRSFLSKSNIKLDGFRVVEPHQDGSEHWHVLCYVKKKKLAKVKDTIQSVFLHSPHAIQIKEDFTGAARPGKATAAGYMLKYLIKSIGTGAAETTRAANDADFADETEAADAWRSTWGIRSFQFFGVLFGKQTLWREMRRLKTQPTEDAAKALWRAARGGRADRFIGIIINEEPELATIREITTEWTTPDANGETEQYTKNGRIVGVNINQIEYITHTTFYKLETDYSGLNDDIFSGGYSYSVSTQGSATETPKTPNHPPPTAPPDPKPR